MRVYIKGKNAALRDLKRRKQAQRDYKKPKEFKGGSSNLNIGGRFLVSTKNRPSSP